LTTALLFTADLNPTGLVVGLQAQQRRMGGLAAQYAHDQAAEEIAKAARVDAELVKLGYPLPDGAPLLARAREWLERCEGHRRNGEHSEAYADAQNALRAIRILMRAHWEQAVRDLSSPVASPYAVSFFTLPRHYQLRDQILHLQAGRNVLPHGDFELPPDQVPPGWSVQEVPSPDKVIPLARRVDKTTVKPHEGRQCLMLKITPQDSRVPPLALERTFLAIHSPEVRLEPGTIVRISAWVLVPTGVSTSGDGAMFYDSAGGEPLAVRLTGLHPRWQRVTLYRQVPASGTIRVTVALTGFGTAYFDDIRIEPLGAEGATESGTARGGTGAVIQAGARGEPSPARWTTPAQAPTAGDRLEALRAGSRGRFPGE
jgi:hypothetical protein